MESPPSAEGFPRPRHGLLYEVLWVRLHSLTVLLIPFFVLESCGITFLWLGLRLDSVPLDYAGFGATFGGMGVAMYAVILWARLLFRTLIGKRVGGTRVP